MHSQAQEIRKEEDGNSLIFHLPQGAHHDFLCLFLHSPPSPPPTLVTWQRQSCCTWAFENTNKCRAGLWPSLTPLCRANLLSSFWMTRVWIRAICLNLRNIFSHNRTQLALTTAHNTKKSNCWADSTLWTIQEQTNWSVSHVWQLAWALQSPTQALGDLFNYHQHKGGSLSEDTQKTSLQT